MDKLTVTGGTEHAYLDSITRTKLWYWADRLNQARNKIVAEAVKREIERLEREGK